MAASPERGRVPRAAGESRHIPRTGHAAGWGQTTPRRVTMSLPGPASPVLPVLSVPPDPLPNDPPMTDASILVGYKQPDDSEPGLPPPSPLDRRPARWWLWFLTLIVFGAIVFLQQATPQERLTPQERQALAVGDTVEPPEASMLVLLGKFLLAAEKYTPNQPTSPFLEMADQLAGGERDRAQAGAESGDQKEGKRESIGPPAADRFRVAVLAGDVVGPDEARERLRELEQDLSPTSPLHEDIRTALTIYEQGPDAVDPARIDALIDRHGWFGRLLASHGRDDTDPFRAAAVASGMSAMVFFVVFGFGLLLAGAAGVVLLIIGAVLGAGGKIRSATAGSVVARQASGVWLETFAVFLLGFLALKLGGAYIASRAAPGAVWPIWVQLLGQWSLVLLVLWPLARGMRFDQFCNEVGWRRGRGVLHEIGAGLAAYIAALPIYVAVAITVAILMWAVRQITGAEPPMPDNRVFEIFEKGTPAMTALLASLVVIWAPLVEETIFRGALFRAVRPRAGAVGAALLTAAMFALMHQYGLPQLIVVGTLGVIFALMREWRGSLLPSMTAHAVHNFMVMVILLVVIQFARG